MSHSIEPICYLFIDLFTYTVITFSKHLYKQYIIAIISTESVNLTYYINKSSNHNRYRSWEKKEEEMTEIKFIGTLGTMYKKMVINILLEHHQNISKYFIGKDLKIRLQETL